MAKWREKKKDRKPEWEYLKESVDKIFTDTKSVRDKMTRHLELFEGNLWDTKGPNFTDFNRPAGRSYAQYNTIFAAVQAVAPMVTDARPITKVAPRHSWAEKIGIRLNDVLEYAWDAYDLQMHWYKAVIDAMVMSLGITKVGYNPQHDEVQIDLIDPRDFFIAPGYDEIWDAPFCGVKAPKPLSWVRENFPDLDEIIPDESEGEDSKKAFKFGDSRGVESDMGFVTVYEHWIKDAATLAEIAEDEGKQKFPYGKIHYYTKHQDLGEVPCTDEHGLPPYVELWDYSRPHNFVGMSEVDQIEGIHKEVNVLIKYLSEHVRRHSAPNFLIDVYQLQDESVDAIMNKLIQGNQYFPWDSAGGTKQPPIQQIGDGQLVPEMTQLLTFLIDVIDVVSGVTDVSRGQVGKQERQSASEVAMLQENSNTRTRQRVRNLEWSMKRVSYLILRNVMQYQKQPKEFSSRTDEGRKYFWYGNSKAQAEEIMRPRPMNEAAQDAVSMNKPLVGKNQEEVARYEQEKADYEEFLRYFGDVGELDPVFVDFDIEIQTDSTLPTDKQSRANLFLRLAQLKMIGPRKLYEQLQIPGAEEAIKEIQEMSGGGNAQMQQMMQQMKAQQQQRRSA